MGRRISWIALAAVLALTTVSNSLYANSAVYQKTLKSTAWVVVKTDQGYSLGSGVLIDKERRLVLTNYHVVQDSRDATIYFPAHRDGEVIAERSHYIQNESTLGIHSKVIAIDRRRDLALVELPTVGDDIPAIEIAEKGATPGETVHSLGNPASTDALWVYTSGTVRAVYRKQFRTQAGEHKFKVLETDTPINPGDSGGPVVNDDGQLVGISQALSTQARLVTYSVDISEIKALLAEDWKAAPRPVDEVLAAASVEYKKDKNGIYAVDVEAEGDKHEVFVTGETEYYKKVEVRKVWSLAATLGSTPSGQLLMSLLEQNSRTKLGSWSVEQAANGKFLILFVAKVDATASPEGLRSAMEYVARVTVVLEKQLNPPAEPQKAAGNWFKNL
jgi:S1-C subfamily serine protease